MPTALEASDFRRQSDQVEVYGSYDYAIKLQIKAVHTAMRTTLEEELR
jgi:hypothetical protein